MSYTDMDIEMKALSMLGESVPDEDADMLRAVCSAAAAELESRLRRGASSDGIGETFVTASAMLAISMYMELGSAHSGGVSGFTAGKLSVQLGGASAAALRKSAETLLGAYLARIEAALAGTVRGLQKASEPEKLRYYQTALAEIQEMRKHHDDCP